MSMSSAVTAGMTFQASSLLPVGRHYVIGLAAERIKIGQIGASAPDAEQLRQHLVAALVALLFQPVIQGRPNNLALRPAGPDG